MLLPLLLLLEEVDEAVTPFFVVEAELGAAVAVVTVSLWDQNSTEQNLIKIFSLLSPPMYLHKFTKTYNISCR